MIGVGALGTLLSGAAGALGAASAVARHAAWWVRYQVEGTVREHDAVGQADAKGGARDDS